MTTGHIAGIAVRNPQMLTFGRHYGLTWPLCAGRPGDQGWRENAVKLAKADIVPPRRTCCPSMRLSPGSRRRARCFARRSMTVLPTYRPRVRIRPADRSRRHGLLITLGMYPCRFQASTDETVNNDTPEAAGSVMGAETPYREWKPSRQPAIMSFITRLLRANVRRLQIGDR